MGHFCSIILTQLSIGLSTCIGLVYILLSSWLPYVVFILQVFCKVAFYKQPSRLLDAILYKVWTC